MWHLPGLKLLSARAGWRQGELLWDQDLQLGRLKNFAWWMKYFEMFLKNSPSSQCTLDAFFLQILHKRIFSDIDWWLLMWRSFSKNHWNMTSWPNQDQKLSWILNLNSKHASILKKRNDLCPFYCISIPIILRPINRFQSMQTNVIGTNNEHL